MSLARARRLRFALTSLISEFVPVGTGRDSRRGRRSQRWTTALLPVALGVVCCAIFCVNASAQTAHFVSTANTLFNQHNDGLSGPYAVAVDGNGNVYIADNSNGRVVKETLAGGAYTQTTIGSGMSEPSGVAVDGSGNVYVADFGNNRVLLETWISGSSYTQSVLFSSGLDGPFDVLVDGSGDVYISDSGHGRVLLETLSGGSYSESAIVTGLSAPYGLALDTSGNIYVTDINVDAV
jgi:DNA-binding beta-propeller fold protein YncE